MDLEVPSCEGGVSLAQRAWFTVGSWSPPVLDAAALIGVSSAGGLLIVSLVCVLEAELSLNHTERRDATKLCALTVVQPL